MAVKGVRFTIENKNDKIFIRDAKSDIVGELFGDKEIGYYVLATHLDQSTVLPKNISRLEKRMEDWYVFTQVKKSSNIPIE